MTTTPIESSGYGYTYQRTTQAREDSEAAQAEAAGNRRTRETGAGSGVRELIDDLLSNVPRTSNGRLTFDNVINYRKGQEKAWDERFKADMAEKGIDTEKSGLSLSLDPSSGKVSANANHPDKAAIDQYFIDNPDMAEQFAENVQLGKLTSLAERKLTLPELRRSLSTQSMSVWFEASAGASSLYTGGGMVFGGSGASYAGLNLRV
jgi:hypothetical protein